jgi:hypothetical protein
MHGKGARYRQLSKGVRTIRSHEHYACRYSTFAGELQGQARIFSGGEDARGSSRSKSLNHLERLTFPGWGHIIRSHRSKAFGLEQVSPGIRRGSGKNQERRSVELITCRLPSRARLSLGAAHWLLLIECKSGNW